MPGKAFALVTRRRTCALRHPDVPGVTCVDPPFHRGRTHHAHDGHGGWLVWEAAEGTSNVAELPGL